MAEYSLRYYQKEAIDDTIDFLLKKEGNPIVGMPTGTGKTIVNSGLINRVDEIDPLATFLVLTHVKELVEQNYKTYKSMHPYQDVGVCCTGVGRKDFDNKVLFGSVGTIVNSVKKVGYRSILIIDEAHLVSPKSETSYRKIISHLKEINPNLRVIGLTATPYRLGQGYLTDDGLFTHFSYDCTDMDGFNRLLQEGFLCRVVPKKTDFQFDVSGIKKTAGDFNQKDLQEKFDNSDVTKRAVNELVRAAEGRYSWLIFAAGVKHSDHIADYLTSLGIRAESVHTKKPTSHRDRSIDLFKRGHIKCLVNNGILTTGFDHPQIDLIGMLRPTTSTSLWVQMVGRGTRPAPGKKDCLVLDFAGNTQRLGPINDPIPPKKPGQKKTAGYAPVKICPECSTYNHTTTTMCIVCGYEFPKHIQISDTASNDELIAEQGRVFKIETFEVDRVLYKKHQKGKFASLKVTYQCGLKIFSSFIHFERDKYPRHMAEQWFLQRKSGEVPKNVDGVLEIAKDFLVPKKIMVELKTKKSHSVVLKEYFE